MASKTFMVVLGVLLATILLVSSEVAAREIAEQQEKNVNDASVADQKYGRGGYNGPGQVGDDNGPSGGGYPVKVTVPPPRCPHGCCAIHFAYCRCCATADEKPDAEYMTEPHN